MPTVTFTVTGRLLDFGDDPVVGVKVTATATPSIKVGDVAVHSNQPDTTVTDEEGNFSLELVSLPGLWYKITAGRAINPVRIAAYTPEPSDTSTGTVFDPDTTFDIHDLMDEQPNPNYQGIIVGGVVDHGELEGLEDDDHPQYLTQARGDARYFTQAETIDAIAADVDAETAARQAADVILGAAISAGDAALDARLDAVEDPAYRDGRYYTKPQVDDAFATKADLTDLEAYTSLTALADEEAARIAADSAHAADTTGVHGIANTAALVVTTDPRLSDARTPLTHSHTSAQITDFVEAAQDAVAALLAGASGVSLSYDDAANTLTITGGGAAGLDAEAVRDAIGVALIGAGLISVAVNDALDTITISTTATANQTDAYLLNRTNHTGSQPQSSIDNLTTDLAALSSGKAPTIHIHNGVDIADLSESIDDRVAALLAAGTGITLSYNDATGALTISTTGLATSAQGAKADTALQPASAQAINAQTGTSYTLVAGDAGKLVTLTNAAAIALSVPGNVFTGGQRVDVAVLGAGVVTVAGSAGATGIPASVTSRAAVPTAFSIQFLSPTSYFVVGDMA